MHHEYKAKIVWNQAGPSFLAGKYSRAHQWSFDGRIEIEASASPLGVPLPWSRADAVDPEEAFVAAVASCHMLTFLYLASKKGVEIARYVDEAVGRMELNENGRRAVTEIVLRPKLEFAGAAPAPAILDELHHAAHDDCYIANSVRTAIRVMPA